MVRSANLGAYLTPGTDEEFQPRPAHLLRPPLHTQPRPGVSLVEADAVVFYDHDLNPVMDAKAQEWCDRIGRRKDVHIYR